MWYIDKAYIDGKFVTVSGSKEIDSINPANEEVIGRVRLADRDDARRAIDAAVKAQSGLREATRKDRVEMLMALKSAVLRRAADLEQATIEEYGGPLSRSRWVSQYAAQCFSDAANILQSYRFTQKIGAATVVMEPVGVSALIAPWNSVTGSVCSKLAFSLAAGCASVIKPSELSALQSRVLAEALHDAGLPAGVFNILLGNGDDVGDEICRHPHVARISFTGSTATGKSIARTAMETLKRINLGLTGKSASILLEDADLDITIPLAIGAAFLNNGQACVAGTRLLVPNSRLHDVIPRIQRHVSTLKIGLPDDPTTEIGPLASRNQYERIQHYIRRGVEQGAVIIAGGEGRPEGLEKGYFVRPTVFANVDNEMDIAREEIFGPVLSVIGYSDQDDAIRIANDSPYGLQAYLFTSTPEKAWRIAPQLQAGSVLINRIAPELLAPFGGVKQSGIGREFGIFGLESFLEPKSIVTG
ncbi:aldehyde dehydrogenase family protein [Erwinia sp. JUb26]|uniref:aldehyde dehydrogenase family protein n=1 Tax=Erwinia sp. JUb26 TaxID=2485126 RepID=UPI000F4A4965|nr:aldehyde dehydrogenase family protein [Erwinia sp. JUb26]ROR15157.1 aldehyde dehydrogenase (NAD+) [Erwinia sp. JUb26]